MSKIEEYSLESGFYLLVCFSYYFSYPEGKRHKPHTCTTDLNIHSFQVSPLAQVLPSSSKKTEAFS